MSADLFAEFNSLSSNDPSPPAQQHQPPQNPYQQQSQAFSQPQTHPRQASFGFSQSSFSPAAQTPPTAAWPTFQPQSGAAASWGNQAPISQPAAAPQQPTEEDDGWGDFETAESTAAPPAPAPVSPQVRAPSYASFGSFSNTSSNISWRNSTPAAPAGAAASPAPVPPQEPIRNRVVRASTIDLMSNNLVDLGNVSQRLPPQSRPQPQQSSPLSWNQPATSEQRVPKPRNLDVLFDAEDFELQDGEDDDGDGDEFGDFETVAPSAPSPKPAAVPAQAQLPSMDLLSLVDDGPQSTRNPASQKQPPTQLLGLSFGSTATTYPQAPRSPSFQDRNPFPDLAIKTPTGPKPKEKEKNPASATPNTAWPTFDDILSAKSPPRKQEEAAKANDDGWGDAWEEFPTDEPQQQGIDSTKPPESWDWDTAENVQAAAPNTREEDTPPPINVPPPSVILSIFPDELSSGNSLFKPMSKQNPSIRQRILNDPKALDFLQAYILLATTAARVIAGRKQRWHRDKILAKSMSISAAGSKGMKLAGVDKTQSQREDREAAYIVAVWGEQVGQLRSAVAAANATGKISLKVPEISETMHIQTAKMVPTAPKACVVCGLKREERVAKVDYEVEDSFGEWWVDHWGHKACKNFWIEHEQKMRTR